MYDHRAVLFVSITPLTKVNYILDKSVFLKVKTHKNIDVKSI